MIVLLALVGCHSVLISNGPPVRGVALREHRLRAIALDPSAPGTEEALDVWVRDPESDLARTGVFAAIPLAMEPLQARFLELSSAQQVAVFERFGDADGGDAVSTVLLDLLERVDDPVKPSAIVALGGRQDEVAVHGLVGLMQHPDPVLRGFAITSLVPAETQAARDALIARARDLDETPNNRAAAVQGLAPADRPEVRQALVALLAAETSGVGAVIADTLEVPRDPSEVAAGLAATRQAPAAARAAAFLGRMDAPTSEVTARLTELLAHEDPEVRLRAAIALAQQDVAAAGGPLVALLDDPARRDEARGALDVWELGALDALREVPLGTAEGKGLAAGLLVRLGGPPDAARMSALGGDPAGLARGAWGLFPDGRARWTDAVTLAPVDQPLRTAVEDLRARELPADDLNLVWLTRARAWSAGGRSDAARAELDASQQAAAGTFRLSVDASVDADSSFAKAALGEALLPALAESVRAPLVLEAPAAPGLPRIRVTGDLRCTDTPNRTSTPMSDGSESYSYTVDNPDYHALVAELEVTPQTYVSDCTITCAGDFTATSGGSRITSVSPNAYGHCSPPLGTGLVCNATPVVSISPAYANLRSLLESTPAELERFVTRSLKRTAHTATVDTACSGALELALGDTRVAVPVDWMGRRTETWEHLVGGPVDNADGRILDALDTTRNLTTDDTRQADFARALSGAVRGFTRTDAEVRAAYAAAVGPAVAAGDARAARDALLWSRPELIDVDGEAFRAVLLRPEGLTRP